MRKIILVNNAIKGLVVLLAFPQPKTQAFIPYSLKSEVLVVVGSNDFCSGGCQSSAKLRRRRKTDSVALQNRPCDDEHFFLNQVETTVDNVLKDFSSYTNILDLPASKRESLAVARHLNKRLCALRRNKDCPRCWMQRKHCICGSCPPVDLEVSAAPSLNRIFLLMHHKEIGLKIDTAKLILSSFPSKTRLVVAGIDAEYQDCMQEMIGAIGNVQSSTSQTRTCLLLFPDENAKTLEEIVTISDSFQTAEQGYDLIVLDGTWAQARKIVSRYFANCSSHVQSIKLSEDALEILERVGSTDSGHQLRRHCTSWRQVGTFEATRLFLRDWEQVFGKFSRDEGRSMDENETIWGKTELYQQIANNAALRELGPPRPRLNSEKKPDDDKK
ncbi:DTW domain containing protein [Nitzschia inconspicua]|uniref:tRNA-uridine aminocarboxypropyltransferase n=1 Tax=Nitzschia inconspicua TaxID=303405 RepID=A0A9K3LDM5_9STRA|nr:DTW domain containing protein [Nitzschia inconspicua]KAG7359538.1 DTW domain containing protein [Nitzschia inconspicua]